MEGAAELLNKQDLCTREKPQRAAFYEKTDCTCRPRCLNIKKMPQLIFQVFSTQADERRLTVEQAFSKYYCGDLMSDQELENLIDILDVSSEQQYRFIMYKILEDYEKV